MDKYNFFFLTVLVFFALTNTSAQAGSPPGTDDVAEQLKMRWTKLFPEDRIVQISKSSRGNGKPWNITVYKRTKHSTHITRFYPFTITIKRDQKLITKQIELKYMKTRGKAWQYKGISGPKALFTAAKKRKEKENRPESRRLKPLKINVLNSLFLKLMQKKSEKILQNVPDFPVTIITTAFHFNKDKSNIPEKKYVYQVYFRLHDKNKKAYYCKGFIMTVQETEKAYRGTLKKMKTGGCRITSQHLKIQSQ